MTYNEYEIEDLYSKHGTGDSNLAIAIRALFSYMAFMNRNSDGWAYWTAGRTPSEALQQAIFMQHDSRAGIGHGWPEKSNISDDALTAALRRLRSFCTRRELAWRFDEWERVLAERSAALNPARRGTAVSATSSSSARAEQISLFAA